MLNLINNIADIEAKKNKDGFAYWKYEDDQTKLWNIRL